MNWGLAMTRAVLTRSVSEENSFVCARLRIGLRVAHEQSGLEGRTVTGIAPTAMKSGSRVRATSGVWSLPGVSLLRPRRNSIRQDSKR